jgi:anti-anti-sigma factor
VPPHFWLEVKRVGPTTVVKLPPAELIHEEVIDLIGEQLVNLIEASGCRRLVLNFEAVDRIATPMLGALIITHKRLRDKGGRFALCALKPQLREVFEVLRLGRVFTIYDEEQDALAHAH